MKAFLPTDSLPAGLQHSAGAGQSQQARAARPLIRVAGTQRPKPASSASLSECAPAGSWVKAEEPGQEAGRQPRAQALQAAAPSLPQMPALLHDHFVSCLTFHSEVLISGSDTNY